ncbi:hypothetical protein [Microbacterium telephonicum]|uniref:Uncharacterized protein n=1 Tax=Microbacterium telephonicum TaxID=1714841 RepID=A0A498C4A6_9MICO|nr:hypothetical protein [Microbacterium telephonicum]RLK47648.1 hypothetical protein C7474_2243 [Microbacterium telephonicum]
MSWDAAMTAEQNLTQIREDHGLAQANAETVAVRAMAERYGTVSYRQGHRRGWWDGIAWLLHQQTTGFDALTITELVVELRKQDGSIYWPIKHGDPTFWAVCDRCRTNQLFTAEGVCPGCGQDLTEY